jgi:hypothetical protein
VFTVTHSIAVTLVVQ